MSIFGNYVKENYKHHLEKDPNQYWVFRHPTSDDEIVIERLLRNKPTRMELLTTELALTFVESNITYKDEDKLYLSPDEDHVDRLLKIRVLPKALIVELALALNDYVSDWGALIEE